MARKLANVRRYVPEVGTWRVKKTEKENEIHNKGPRGAVKN